MFAAALWVATLTAACRGDKAATVFGPRYTALVSAHRGEPCMPEDGALYERGPTLDDKEVRALSSALAGRGADDIKAAVTRLEEIASVPRTPAGLERAGELAATFVPPRAREWAGSGTHPTTGPFRRAASLAISPLLSEACKAEGGGSAPGAEALLRVVRRMPLPVAFGSHGKPLGEDLARGALEQQLKACVGDDATWASVSAAVKLRP